MRKHLIGFALFSFIVTSAVVIYGSLYYWNRFEEIKVRACPQREGRPVTRENSPVSESLTYKLKSFNIDIEKGTGTVEVELGWRSDETPPAGVRLDFGVVTPEEPKAEIQVGSHYIDAPFASGSTVTQTCAFKLWGAVLDPKVKNYYGYAEVAERDGMTKLVYTEKNRMIGAFPVLVKHPNKK